MDYPGIKYLNPEACTGCRMCEMICSLIHGQDGINPRRSRIKITEKKEKGIFLPKVCQLCKEPACMRACPESALFRDPSTGVILIDEKKCNGCRSCVEACTYDAIFFLPGDEIPSSCDLCGGAPECTKYCLQEAIVFRKNIKHK